MIINNYYMTRLTEEDRTFIMGFIANNQASNLPLVDLKAKKTIQRDFNKVYDDKEDIVFYGSEGHYYSNAFCKIDENIYILTYYLDDLTSYAHYISGYEK